MIRIDFNPARLTGEDAQWWARWSARASAATAQAIADREAGSVHRFRDQIWRALKQWLLDHVFHGKCGYCEAPARATGFGAADHYRPKNKVTIRRAGKTVAVQVDGADHPGYYWLAYHWCNLLPACAQCNTGGKMNHFPVARTYVAVHDAKRNDPDDLDVLEEPLLLHPYRDEPSEFLRFGDKGIVTAIDGNERGRTSIEICKLMRGDLVEERKQRQDYVWIKFLDAMKRADGSARGVLAPYLEGRRPFSKAVVDYVELRLREELTGLVRSACSP